MSGQWTRLSLFSDGRPGLLACHLSEHAGEHPLEGLCWISHAGSSAPGHMSIWPHQHGAVLLHAVGRGPASTWIDQAPLRPNRERVDRKASCMGNFRSRLAPGCACPSRQ